MRSRFGSARSQSSTANAAKVAANGIWPTVARPAATLIMFFSAIPMLKNRCGWRAANSENLFGAARSAVSATMRESVSARLASSSPATKLGIDHTGVPLKVSLDCSG